MRGPPAQWRPGENVHEADSHRTQLFGRARRSRPAGKSGTGAKPVEMYVVDVEGGKAAFIVAPNGRTAASSIREAAAARPSNVT